MIAFTHHALLCHPTGRCPAVRDVDVAVALTDQGGLALRYRVSGDIAALRLPPPRPAGAADGLWQFSCCEVFVGSAGSPGYREFNLSPSGQWAVYQFSGYRERDHGFIPAAAPSIACRRSAGAFTLEAVLAPELLPAGALLQIGLSVVLEADDASKSYWALRHCASQPDFHLRQSFSLILKAVPS